MAAEEDDAAFLRRISNTPQLLIRRKNMARLRQKIREEGYVITENDNEWALRRAAEHLDIDLLIQLNELGFGLTFEYIQEWLAIFIDRHLIRARHHLAQFVPIQVYKEIADDVEVQGGLLFILYLYSQADNNNTDIPDLHENIRLALTTHHMQKLLAEMIADLYDHVGGRISRVLELLIHNIGKDATLKLIYELLNTVFYDILVAKQIYAHELEAAAQKGARLEPNPFEELNPIFRVLRTNYGADYIAKLMMKNSRPAAIKPRLHALALRTPAAKPKLAKKHESVFLQRVKDMFASCSRKGSCGGAAAGAGGSGADSAGQSNRQGGGRRTKRHHRRSSRRR